MCVDPVWVSLSKKARVPGPLRALRPASVHSACHSVFTTGTSIVTAFPAFGPASSSKKGTCLNLLAFPWQLAQQLPGAEAAAQAQQSEGEAVNVKLDAPAPSAGSTGACSC